MGFEQRVASLLRVLGTDIDFYHIALLPSTNSALPLFRLRQPEFEPYEQPVVCQYYFPEVLMVLDMWLFTV